MKIFHESVSFGIYPVNMTLVNVTPFFKSCKRAISVPPCSSKVLCNWNYKYVDENSTSFLKKIDLEKVTLPVTHLRTSLELFSSKLTLAVFVDSSKSFNTVDQNIFLDKYSLSRSLVYVEQKIIVFSGFQATF